MSNAYISSMRMAYKLHELGLNLQKVERQSLDQEQRKINQ